jgi:hypothetical protein
MSSSTATTWTDLLGRCLATYDEGLLRRVAGRLFKPRNQWPADVLLERCVENVGNAAIVDRRLREAGVAERRLLALIGHSRQPSWKLVHLLEMLATLGHNEGVQPVLSLFEGGLLYPVLGERGPRLKNFEQWLGQAAATDFQVFTHPFIAGRALGEDLGLPELPGPVTEVSGAREPDGLEWPLRLAVLWQEVAANPMRRTQNNEFFKRDLDRLRTDPHLNGPPSDNLADLPDAGLLAVTLGVKEGLLREQNGELRSGDIPEAWSDTLPDTLASLWSALPHLDTWNPEEGWVGAQPLKGNPYPSVYLLALLLLARQPEGAWVLPRALEDWLAEHHPYWAKKKSDKTAASPGPGTRPAVTAFLLGFAFQLRMVEAARNTSGKWVTRLTATGRWLLGIGPAPAPAPAFPQTLLVQPNLEVLAYRQGLTPGLIARLSRFAAWKSLGAACTLQLQPESVYRALEAGETFESILQTLQGHSMKATPPAVVDSLRTWANKHERIGVFPSAVLLEFACADHLSDALARGLPATRLSDRLAVVARESDVPFQMFRLTGTRDYRLPPEKCVDIEPDGVTLTIDLARSDLLLETEVRRFAEPVVGDPGPGWGDLAHGLRRYRLTPASITAGKKNGLNLLGLESWFLQRTGQPLSPAGRLLLTGAEQPALELRRLQILTVPAAEIADGLMQWPATKALIVERLGPTALVVSDENADALKARLLEVGITISGGRAAAGE